ncbi:MAG: ATP-binding protein [Clostridiales bacterium]|jgi:DNA replication protein DnaC|nr:ATP-binding protein [Clostridiales bacterium]
MILKEVLENLKDRQSRAQILAEYNYQRALEDERFYQIEKKYREYNFLCGQNPEPKNLQELEKIKARRQQLLDELCLHITPQYACQKCQDSGYQGKELCVCVKREISRRIANMCGVSSNISCNFENCDFGVFKDPKHKELMINTYQKMKQYCAKFPNTNFNSIVFSGATGTGKTYLISCIASQLSYSGFYVFFTTAFGLNNMFLKSHTAIMEEKLQYLEPLIDCDLLIIDDLGTEPLYRNVSGEYLYTIINERKITKKHTLISTNLSLDDILNRYGERIFSRLNNKADSLFLTFDGKDVRLDS